jgi:hypothetical protein
LPNFQVNTKQTSPKPDWSSAEDNPEDLPIEQAGCVCVTVFVHGQ